MAKKQTDAQKIAELVCKRSAAKDKKTLPPKFWNDPEFGRNFRFQLIKANALLKMYSATAILNALNSEEGKRIWSLTAKWLDPIIAKEQKKYEKIQKSQEDYIIEQAARSFDEEEIVSDSPEIQVTRESDGPKKQSLLERLD